MEPKSSAESLAVEILARIRIPGPPYSMEEAAAALGYRVEWEDTAERFGRALGFCWRDRIYVGRCGTPTRDRWTLAHELAHVEADRLNIPHDEAFVDRCASGLLLPRADLLPFLAGALDVVAIAARFGVSVEAAARRILEVRRSLLAIVDAQGRCRTYRSPRAPACRDLAAAIAGAAREAHARRRHVDPRPLGDWTLGAWLTPGGHKAIALAYRL